MPLIRSSPAAPSAGSPLERRARAAAPGPVKPGILSHPARTVTVGFLLANLAGTVLLMLPGSSGGPGGSRFRIALSPSPSAISVTGLAVVDTAGHWSVFGESVLMALMQ